MLNYTPRIHPDWHNETLRKLRDIFQTLKSDRFNWQEADTIYLCIIPVLMLLRFPTRSIRQTVKQIKHKDGFGLRPDFSIRLYGKELGIIEAKKASSDLSARHGYPNSWSPIDQTLRYFDCLHPRYAILTNGLEWIVFREALTNPQNQYPYQYEAMRTNLYDTVLYNDGDMLDEFLYNFNYQALDGGQWPGIDSDFKKHTYLDRVIDEAHVMMHDFSYDNKYRNI
ncbi:type I restriction enzyme HsdR N-terminal domain-containing protein [Sphingomonas sp. PP-CC-3A-396]|uniref:type I restriction enzyme HsdR N-terminal domain-containing protein n=1 Tax=Sphingomonas sp. PP-CC-3A-396 TaxID=2135655 RepID=UPI00104F5BE3|nr:type I restriction enzyme HsdR N-terminal domain-containing protein [Sphingomonas sp. PP-CC-3A-396]TCQ03385.1 type I restriction and modification enzyme subunit R-like protein [Sphingomonas sp. PP-CC-3A-396]